MNRHSSEQELLKLLTQDVNQFAGDGVAEHVEGCAQCQTKLQKLSAQDNLTNAMLAHLRTLANGESELRDFSPLTNIELKVTNSDCDDIELESVSHDFLEPAKHPELLGRIGRYDVERVIGAGGMGVVFKAHDGELHRSVAIKVLAPHLANSVAARKRFSREAKAAAAVIHPNVIPIHDVESDGKVPYLVMQYVSGESLQARVDARGPLPVTDVLRIAQQTAAGLSAAHAQGLIHRDVKPANILLEESVDRVVLSDFGLARTVDDASLTRTGIVTGTPHYMSPEQANGESIDCRSDQFSLGCVIYFMLTGRPPFRAATAMGVLNRICHDTHRPVQQMNDEVPRELSRLVDRLFMKSANARFDSMSAIENELSNLLAAIQGGEVRLARITSVRSFSSRLVTRSTMLVASGLLLCFVVAAAMNWRSTLFEESSPTVRADDQKITSQRIVQELPISKVEQSVRSVAIATNTSTPVDPVISQVQNFFAMSRQDDWHRKLTTVSSELESMERGSNSWNIQWAWLDQQTMYDRESIKMLRWQLELMEVSQSPTLQPKPVLR